MSTCFVCSYVHFCRVTTLPCDFFYFRDVVPSMLAVEYVLQSMPTMSESSPLCHPTRTAEQSSSRDLPGWRTDAACCHGVLPFFCAIKPLGRNLQIKIADTVNLAGTASSSLCSTPCKYLDLCVFWTIYLSVWAVICKFAFLVKK